MPVPSTNRKNRLKSDQNKNSSKMVKKIILLEFFAIWRMRFIIVFRQKASIHKKY